MEKTVSNTDALHEELDRLRREVDRLRQREERQNAAMESFHHQVLDGIPIQVAVFDEQLRFSYVNPASVDDPERRRWILGKTHSEYLQATEQDPALAKTFEKWQRRAIRERRSVTFEEDMPDREGNPRYVLRTHSPVFNDDGSLCRLIGYGVDITEHKALERRLMEAQKLDAVGKLAGAWPMTSTIS